MLSPSQIPTAIPPLCCFQGSGFRDTKLCSGSEAGSYLRLIDFVHHSTLGLRVIKKKKRSLGSAQATWWSSTLSSKVSLPYAINFRALCGAQLVT